MTETNFFALFATVSSEIDNIQGRIALFTECLKAQEFLTNELKYRADLMKQERNHLNSSNLKLHAEIKYSEQEQNSMRTSLEAIRCNNMELKKKLLLASDNRLTTLTRTQEGVKKYEKLWLESKKRFENTPYFEINNKTQILKAKIDALTNERDSPIKMNKDNQSKCRTDDKKRIVKLANYTVKEKPKIVEDIKNARENIETVVQDLKKKPVMDTNDDFNKIILLDSKWPIESDDNKGDTLIKNLVDSPNITNKPDKPIQLTTPKPITSENPSSIFKYSYVSIEDMETPAEPKNYAQNKLINILEEKPLCKRDAIGLLLNLNPFEKEIQTIGGINDSKMKDHQLKNTGEVEDAVDITSTYPSLLLPPPPQFQDLSANEKLDTSKFFKEKDSSNVQKRKADEVNEDGDVNKEHAAVDTTNVKRRKNEKQDMGIDDVVISSPKLNYNTPKSDMENEEVIMKSPYKLEDQQSQEQSQNRRVSFEEVPKSSEACKPEDQNVSVNGQMLTSLTSDDYDEIIRNLKKHDLQLSPVFAYTKNQLNYNTPKSDMENEEVIMKSPYKLEDQQSQEQSQNRRVSFGDVPESSKACKPEDQNVSVNGQMLTSLASDDEIIRRILKEHDLQLSPVFTYTKNQPDSQKFDGPGRGLLFTHGSNIKESPNLSMEDNREGDFPQRFGSRLLHSPKADMQIPASSKSTEVTSEDVPNFLKSCRRLFSPKADMQIPTSSKSTEVTSEDVPNFLKGSRLLHSPKADMQIPASSKSTEVTSEDVPNFLKSCRRLFSPKADMQILTSSKSTEVTSQDLPNFLKSSRLLHSPKADMQIPASSKSTEVTSEDVPNFLKSCRRLFSPKADMQILTSSKSTEVTSQDLPNFLKSSRLLHSPKADMQIPASSKSTEVTSEDVPNFLNGSRLLHSPKADMQIPASSKSTEVTSEDVPNFLKGFRKFSFFGTSSSTE